MLWSRGRDADIGDRNETVRNWFGQAGFREVAYEAREGGERAAMGVVQYEGEAVELDAARRLFTFVR